MAVDLNDGRSADARGWGPGWPNCDPSRWVGLSVLSLKGRVVRFPAHKLRGQGRRHVFEEEVRFGSLRQEIRDLVSLLVQVSERRGHINLQPGWCFGGACRAIKRADGTFTNTPSNHSWGLAVDVNSRENWIGDSAHTIPAAMGKLWNAYGFRWGGDYAGTKDWMHFEFMGTPADAKVMTEKARRELAGEVEDLTPEQEKALTRMSTFLDTLAAELGKAKEDEGGGDRDTVAPKFAAKRVAKAVLKSERA